MIVEVVVVTICGAAYVVIAGWPGIFYKTLFTSTSAIMLEQALALYM